MKTKLILTSIAALLVILTGCAAPKTTTSKCPACGARAHFNSQRSQVIGQEKRSFDYIKNNVLTEHVYTVPKIAATTDSWECANGHVIQVKH